MRKLGEHYMQSIHRERKKKTTQKKRRSELRSPIQKKKKQGNSGKGEGEEKRVLLKDCDHSWRHIQQKKNKEKQNDLASCQTDRYFFSSSFLPKPISEDTLDQLLMKHEREKKEDSVVFFFVSFACVFL